MSFYLNYKLHQGTFEKKLSVLLCYDTGVESQKVKVPDRNTSYLRWLYLY